MSATCSTCPFWAPDTDDPKVGDCRALPPQPLELEGGDSRIFPATTEDDWCGHHPGRKEVPR